MGVMTRLDGHAAALVLVLAAPGLLGRTPRYPVLQASTAVERLRNRTAFVLMRAAPVLLSLRPASFPASEARVAVEVDHVCGATPAVVGAAPNLLACGPRVCPVGKAHVAVIGHSCYLAALLVLRAAPLLLRWAPEHLPVAESHVAVESIACPARVLTAPHLFLCIPGRLPATEATIAVEALLMNDFMDFFMPLRLRSRSAALVEMLTAPALLFCRPGLLPVPKECLAVIGLRDPVMDVLDVLDVGHQGGFVDVGTGTALALVLATPVLLGCRPGLLPVPQEVVAVKGLRAEDDVMDFFMDVGVTASVLMLAAPRLLCWCPACLPIGEIPVAVVVLSWRR